MENGKIKTNVGGAPLYTLTMTNILVILQLRTATLTLKNNDLGKQLLRYVFLNWKLFYLVSGILTEKHFVEQEVSKLNVLGIMHQESRSYVESINKFRVHYSRIIPTDSII